MQWLRYQHPHGDGLGLLDVDRVLVHSGGLFSSPRPTGETLAVAEVNWLPPCQPGKVIGLWNNYRAAAAKNGWAEPAEPLYFLKATTSLTGHGSAIPAPLAHEGRVVYEGELAVVIGRQARGVPVAEATRHILGYSCANDVTAIELLHRDASFAQWTRAKSFNGFCALGPVIDTTFDPAAGGLRTLVGGRERQNYRFNDMFFSPAELVSRLSFDMTLEPGDVILCGTSLGALPMKPGTVVEVVIAGIGTLRNTYAAAGT